MNTITRPFRERTTPPSRPDTAQDRDVLSPKGQDTVLSVFSSAEACGTTPDFDQRVEAACAKACSAIAPAWPLDRAIAVNPHWERIGMPVRAVAARMAVLGRLQVFPPRDQLRAAWHSGRIQSDDLRAALLASADARACGLDEAACIAALGPSPALPQLQQLPQLPLLIDVLDDDPQGQSRLSWRQAITHQLSQTCAAYFDRHQADWQPQRSHGLYAFWRDTLLHDHGIGVLMGLPDIARGLQALPDTREAAERWVLSRLGLPEDAWADYLEAVLLTVNGWPSWCAYLGWQARLQGGSDSHLRDLLAIRLAWGAVLLECRGGSTAQRAFAALQVAWEQSAQRLQEAHHHLLVDEVWQNALDIGYQRDLAQRLAMVAPAPMLALGPGGTPVPAPEVQAVFCIDVRSEPLRRAIESAWPAVQTLGFAGFFGLPVSYSPLGTSLDRPQLPGLLAPALSVTDEVVTLPLDASAGPDAQDVLQARHQHFRRTRQWRAGTRWPNAAFSSVEAIGAGYVGKMIGLLRPGKATRRVADDEGLSARYRPVCRPTLAGLGLEAKVALAARVLHAMSMDRTIAPLVLLMGHGSQSLNNAQAAALDCGACCGQTGEVNARALARLLNEPPVQAGLRARGLPLPADVAFVAALHNTTTDEIEGFDLDLLPLSAQARWSRLQPVLVQAGDQVRRERAASLGLDPRMPAGALLSQLQRRANDAAQIRPEWGLAGNAAFVMAPRSRTRGSVLHGRVFLHDYDAEQDADGSVLELLMTAPMLVTHWINWQYHASTSEPTRLGSGNKLLHNVVGGNLGVFEGNGGDLRIGLARQSVHDGEDWRHEAVRLTVVIDAPADAIDRILQRHAVVRQLVEHGWLHLWRFAEGGGFQRWVTGEWRPESTR